MDSGGVDVVLGDTLRIAEEIIMSTSATTVGAVVE